MSDVIRVLGISAHGFHGVFAQERAVGQQFVVDVELSLDLAPAGKADDLSLTLDYSAVARLVVEQIQGEPVALIETLAERIAQSILEYELVQSVLVTVHKPQAPLGVDFTDVQVQIRRGK